jgi:putative ABC transport system permease protein
MDAWIKDLRYGLRMLLKKPGFTVVATLALALGIGANTAIFSIVNALLINPLPFPKIERLVAVWEKIPSQGLERNETAVANYFDWKAQNSSFENVALYTWWNANLSGVEPPERLQGFIVTTNFLDTVGVQPVLGRGFLPEEEQPGKDQVAIISNGLWKRRFAADPNIINQPITINGVSRLVVGVMPETFNYPMGMEVLAPTAYTPKQASNRDNHGNLTIARLKDGVTIQQAQSDMDAIAARLEQQYPQSNTGRGVALFPLLTDTVRHYRAALTVISIAVGFVLLIACANVANLMLARASGRGREISLRTALGASRWRIIRQLLSESVLLSALGGAFGILLALWGTETLKTALPNNAAQFIIGWRNIGIDLDVLAFTLVLSLAVGILFGLAPALQLSKIDLNEALKEGSGKSSASGHRNRLRSILVVSEVALSLILLIGGGLAIKSFWGLLKFNPGFRPDNVITMQVSLPRARYDNVAKRFAFFDELTRRVEGLTGVESAGLVNYLPLGGANSSDAFLVEDLPAPPPGQEFVGRYRVCTPNYFQALGVTLSQGRGFSDQDRQGTQPVAIVNETMAREYWNGEALGKRFRIMGELASNPWMTVIGVIKDVKHELYSPVTAEYYLPMAQDVWSTMIVVARGRGEAKSLTAAIRGEVVALDKDQPVYQISTMEEVRAISVLPYSFSGLLLCIFAAIALLLAAVGIYGVVSYAVSQRTHEIGIRMALGASRGDVLKLIIKQGMLPATIGLSIGWLAAFALAQLMGAALVGVSPKDLSAFVGIPVVLTLVAFFACYIPARRATRVDPMIALRYE